MSVLDLKDFETRITLRQLNGGDYDAVVALQLRCFPTMKPWTRDQFESQVTTFPEGQLGIEIDGRLVASAACLIVDYADYSNWDNWKEIADSGFIRNHDPEGDTLYGIEIQVDPEFRGMKLARRLYAARKDVCRDDNLARMVIGGRIPGYAVHRHELTPHEYVDQVVAKKLIDPVLTAQLANGFVLQQLIPDYMPSDADSAGYATCLEWPNLDYRPPRSRRARRAFEPVRVAFVQYQMRRIASWEDFATQCEFFVDVASDSKADFLLFPELFTVQLLSLVEAHEYGAAARELAKFTPQYLDLFTSLAVRYNVNLIAGSQFTLEGDQLYNVSYLCRRDGTIERQRKVHTTPNERRWWGIQGGDDVHVFDTDRGKISILICYDVEFPELARVATQKGAKLLFVPFNTNDRYGYLRVRLTAQARAIENQVYVITSGCVGNLPMVENADTHYAQSGIYTPSDISFARDGIANEASPNLETVVVHDLDLELLRRARQRGTVRTWTDRRTDLYRVVWRSGDEYLEV